MKNKKMEFIRTEKTDKSIAKVQVKISPVMIILPMILSSLLIIDWYIRGYSTGSSSYDVELILGLIILFGNIIFYIPFIKSLSDLDKK